MQADEDQSIEWVNRFLNGVNNLGEQSGRRHTSICDATWPGRRNDPKRTRLYTAAHLILLRTCPLSVQMQKLQLEHPVMLFRELSTVTSITHSTRLGVVGTVTCQSLPLPPLRVTRQLPPT